MILIDLSEFNLPDSDRINILDQLMSSESFSTTRSVDIFEFGASGYSEVISITLSKLVDILTVYSFVKNILKKNNMSENEDAISIYPGNLKNIKDVITQEFGIVGSELQIISFKKDESSTNWHFKLRSKFSIFYGAVDKNSKIIELNRKEIF